MLEVYEAREKRLKDEATNLAVAGEEGLKRGLEQGIKQGLEQTARNLLKAGVDMKIIVETTGLTRKAIESLR